MKKLLITLFLFTPLACLAQDLQVGPAVRRPTIDDVYNINVNEAGYLIRTPKVGPSTLIPIDSGQVKGWTAKFTAERSRAAGLFKDINYSPPIASSTVPGLLSTANYGKLDYVPVRLTDSLSLVNARFSTLNQTVGFLNNQLADKASLTQIQATNAAIAGRQAAGVLSQIRSLTATPDNVYYLTTGGNTGNFRLDASDTSTPDNGITVLVTASGARYKRVADALNAVDHAGAKGDYTTDDTQALQNIINVACAANNPGTFGNATPRKWSNTVLIPAGYYRVTDEIFIPGSITIRMEESSSYGGTRIQQVTAGKNLFHIKADNDGSASGVHLIGGILKGGVAGSTPDVALIYGGDATGDGNNNSTYIDNVWFQTPETYGANFKKGDDIHFRNCTFDVSGAHAIKFGGTAAGSIVVNSSVEGCTFYDIRGGAIDIQQALGLTIKNNHAYPATGIRGTYFVSAVNSTNTGNLDMSGNMVEGMDVFFTTNVPLDLVKITGNSVKTAKGQAINLGGGGIMTRFQVQNNSFDGDFSGTAGGVEKSPIYAYQTGIRYSLFTGNLFFNTAAAQAIPIQFDVTRSEFTQVANNVSLGYGSNTSALITGYSQGTAVPGFSASYIGQQYLNVGISPRTIYQAVSSGSGSSDWQMLTNPVSSTATGDMLKSTYDPNNDGVVVNSEALNGQQGSYYLSRNNATGTQSFSTLTGTASTTQVGMGSPAAGKYLDGSGSWTPLPAYTGATYTGNALVVVDFNSLGAGRGSSNEISSVPDQFPQGPFPTTMMNSLTATFPSATFTKKNYSVSGRQTPTMISDAPRVDALFNPTTYDRNVVVAGEITNHIADGGASSDAAYASYVTYCKARRAKGFLVVSTTVLPRTTNFGSGISASTFETRRLAVNDSIRKNYLKFSDVLADITSLTALTYPDGTHTNDAGYVLIGNFIAGKVAPLLVAGFNPQSIAYLLSGVTTTTVSSGTSTTATSGTGVVLSLKGQGANNSTTFTDDAGHTVTGSGNAKISTTQFKFGTSSIYLDGSAGTYLTTPSTTDFNFGVADFTMEAWIYKTGNGSGYPGVFARGDNSQNQWALCFPSAGARLEFYVSGSGGYLAQGLNHSVDVPLNQWVHIALVSSGGVRKLYQNGTLVGTAGTNSNLETNTTGKPVLIGFLPAISSSGGDVFPGYMHVLFTKSAKYLTTGFTPPASF